MKLSTGSLRKWFASTVGRVSGCNNINVTNISFLWPNLLSFAEIECSSSRGEKNAHAG
jgi:hypothetical protein